MSRIGDRGEMAAFVRAVETGSFSAAARELKLTPSALSKLVTRLEKRLKVRLLTRSTRKVAPTAEGELFAARCRQILSEIEDAESEITSSRESPRGLLRMHMGVGFGMSQGVKALPRFLERYPEVQLDLMIEDRAVDLMRENVDISLWFRPPESGNVVARKLFEFGRITCASPAYLERHGVPRTPHELSRHRCLIVTTFPPTQWMFQTTSGALALDLASSVSVNNAECKYRFALDGMGVAQFNEYVVADALRDGRLVEVLPDFPCPQRFSGLALYPRDRHRLPRVAAMLDFLADTFSTRPWRNTGAERAKRVLKGVRA